MDSILCISRLVEAAVRKMYFKVDVLKFRNIRKETPLLQWNCNCEYCDVFRTVFFKTSGGCFCNEFLGNQDLKYMIEKKKNWDTDVEINPLTVKWIFSGENHGFIKTHWLSRVFYTSWIFQNL